MITDYKFSKLLIAVSLCCVTQQNILNIFKRNIVWILSFFILETKLLTFHVNTLKTPTTAIRQDFGEKIKWETLVQLLKQSLYSVKSGY